MLMENGRVLLVTVMMLLLVTTVHSQRLRDVMYDSIYSGGSCFRRLNGTHQIGCSSSRGGSVGVLHYITGSHDVEWILKNASAGPYAPVIPVNFFTKEIVDKFIDNPDIITGIVVVNNGTHRPSNLSPDQRCPNQRSQWMTSNDYCENTQSDTDVWNPYGSGIMYRDIPFPIFYLPPEKKEDIQKLYDCYTKFNSFDKNEQSSRSLCAIEMNAFMFGAVNSEVCTRRTNTVKNLSASRYCDPLSDKSVLATLFPRGTLYEKGSDFNDTPTNDDKTTEKKPMTETKGSIILVTAAMDATSLFEGVGFGAVTTISGLVTLLATIEALQSMFPPNSTIKYDKNVMFVALNGESFDYIGSQRMAYDLVTGVYPQEGNDPVPSISPMSIGLHIHLGQLNGMSNILNAFRPNYNETERNENVDDFVKSVFSNSDGLIINKIPGNNLPPSSLHSFLRLLNSSITQMSSVMLASHERNFDNRYYQSILDDADNLAYKYLNLSSSISIDPDTGDVTYPDKEFLPTAVQSNLANISSALALTLYQRVTGNTYNGNIRASPFIIDELIHCYLDTLSCPLMAAYRWPPVKPGKEQPQPAPSLYVGVPGWISPVSHTTIQLAMFLNGVKLKRNKKECKAADNEAVYYEWISGWNGTGECIRSSINFTLAKSPAFLDEDYDFSSGMYSTWTESVWRSITVRIFLKPPKWKENLSISLGVVVFVVFFFLTLFGRRHVSWLVDYNNSDVDSDSTPPTRSPAEC